MKCEDYAVRCVADPAVECKLLSKRDRGGAKTVALNGALEEPVVGGALGFGLTNDLSKLSALRLALHEPPCPAAVSLLRCSRSQLHQSATPTL